MEIWQGIAILIPVLLASRFAVNRRLQREARDELQAFNEEWQHYQHRFIEENRLNARF